MLSFEGAVVVITSDDLPPSYRHHLQALANTLLFHIKVLLKIHSYEDGPRQPSLKDTLTEAALEAGLQSITLS